jgi:hypothetical protein
MKQKLRYVGLDVHVETIAVAMAEADGGPRSLGTIPNNVEAVRKLIGRLGPAERLRVCYEAGQCGFVLYWKLLEMGVHCAVIAPSLIPQRAGERVKTDRLDAFASGALLSGRRASGDCRAEQGAGSAARSVPCIERRQAPPDPSHASTGEVHAAPGARPAERHGAAHH